MCFFLSLCVFLSKTVFPPTVSLQVPLWFPQSLSLQLRVTHHLLGRIPSLLTWGLFNFPWFNHSNFKKKLKWMFWLLGWWRAGWSLPGSLWFLSLASGYEKEAGATCSFKKIISCSNASSRNEILYFQALQPGTTLEESGMSRWLTAAKQTLILMLYCTFGEEKKWRHLKIHCGV